MNSPRAVIRVLLTVLLALTVTVAVPGRAWAEPPPRECKEGNPGFWRDSEGYDWRCGPTPYGWRWVNISVLRPDCTGDRDGLLWHDLVNNEWYECTPSGGWKKLAPAMTQVVPDPGSLGGVETYNFTITPNSATGHAGGTSVTGRGLCLGGDLRRTCGGSPLANSNLYQDLTPIVPVSKSTYDQQYSCDSLDTDIGSSSIDGFGYITASGTTASRVAAGAYIICAGVDTAHLFGYFTLS